MSIEDESHQVLRGVANGMFLGFVVTFKGIHLDSKKIRAIQKMQPPRNLKKLRGLQGRLTYTEDSYQTFQDIANPSPS